MEIAAKALKLPKGGQIEMDHLSRGVYPSIGASASYYLAIHSQVFKSSLERSHDGVCSMFLALKPLESAAVVCDNRFNTHLIPLGDFVVVIQKPGDKPYRSENQGPKA